VAVGEWLRVGLRLGTLARGLAGVGFVVEDVLLVQQVEELGVFLDELLVVLE